MIAELNNFLLIQNVAWQRLPKRDLTKLHETFQKLREDVDEVFRLLDEVRISAEKPEKIMEKLKNYVV